MKYASPALIALLASRQFYSVDLYNFSLIGGTNLYYCSGDQDINWNGHTWSAGGSIGPYFDRKDNKAKCHWKVGVEVDTLVFDCLPGSATVGGEAFLSFVRQGGFDGAEFTLYRAFMPTYGNTADGTVIMFVGRVAEIDAGRSLATFSINSHLELLNLNMPRNLYQAACANTLYDASCTVSQPGFTSSGTAASGSTGNSINGTGAFLTNVTGYYDLGIMTFTSGANNGFARTVQHFTNGSPGNVTVSPPFPSAPTAGDTFNITAGCNKLQSTCATKFRNLQNFKGFPYIPSPMTSV